MFWYKFPLEIRYAILAYLANSEHYDGKSLTAYVRVATDWQAAFEKLSFRKLRVMPSDLDDFRTIFRILPRRKYIRQLDLVLELPTHELVHQSSVDGTEEEKAMAHMLLVVEHGHGVYSHLPQLQTQHNDDNFALTKAICALFRLLSAWPREEVCRDGIHLKIVADSPSYWQQVAGKLRGRSGPTVVYREVLPRADGGKRFSPVDIGPVLWKRCALGAMADFFFTLDLDFAKSLTPCASAVPKVTSITRLTIPQGNHRRFHPRAMGAIMHRLPLLEAFNWEIKPHAHWSTKQWFDGYLEQAVSEWPLSLKEMRIIQMGYSRLLCLSSQKISSPHLTQLGHKISRLSHRMECLSMEYRTNAYGYFANGPQQWPNLRHLVMRSDRNIADELPDYSNYFLKMAAFGVSRMPKLESLVLYNADRSGAGCFSYEILDHVVAITIRCSWPFQLDKGCLQDWQRAAKTHSNFDVKWRIEEMSANAVRLCIINFSKRHMDAGCDK